MFLLLLLLLLLLPRNAGRCVPVAAEGVVVLEVVLYLR